MKSIIRYCIITTTSDQENIINTIATCLINNNLSNCLQIEPVKSMYKWRGKIETADEYRLQIKALTVNYVAIETIIKKNHNYELPEVIMIEISGGCSKYLEWFKPQSVTLINSANDEKNHIPYTLRKSITAQLIAEAQIVDQEIDLRFRFRGKYCYVDVCKYGIDSPLFRLTYLGNLEYWEYATAKHSNANGSVVYEYTGNPRDHYTLEKAIQLCEDIYWNAL